MNSSLRQWGDFDGFELPSQSKLSELVKAREQSYQCFAPDTAPDRRRDKAELRYKLTYGPPPDYSDPCVAAAYLDTYHLSHCMMAYWSFMHVFGHVGSVPNALYVCDVAAGTGAARVGLALALSKRKKSFPTIHFDAFEPSDAMRRAGNAFWEALPAEIVDLVARPGCGHRQYRDAPKLLPAMATHDDVLRVVTAFHLSLPYENGGQENDIEYARSSIQSALDTVYPHPHIGIFTANSNKIESLKLAVGDYDCEFPISRHPSLPKDSVLLLRGRRPERQVSPGAEEKRQRRQSGPDDLPFDKDAFDEDAWWNAVLSGPEPWTGA